jgi:hypothetical protein
MLNDAKVHEVVHRPHSTATGRLQRQKNSTPDDPDNAMAARSNRATYRKKSG